MGKEWDAPWKANGWQSGGGFSKPGIGERKTEWPSFSATSKFGAVNPTCNACGGRARGKNRCECSEPQWKPIGKRRHVENEGLPSDVTSSGMSNHLRAFQAWCELWSSQCFRILKPNGVIKASSGTRTFHRMTQALKKSGFVDFEVHAWTYGSGFPKSMDVSKQLEKQAAPEAARQWSGYGTALKPAWEPIIVARKPQ